MSQNSGNFFGDLIAGIFIVGGVMKILDLVESTSAKQRAETKAIQDQSRQQQEIDDLRNELRKLRENQ